MWRVPMQRGVPVGHHHQVRRDRGQKSPQQCAVHPGHVVGHEGGTSKEMPMAEDTSSKLETLREVPTEELNNTWRQPGLS